MRGEAPSSRIFHGVLLFSGVEDLIKATSARGHLAHHLGDVNIWRCLVGRSNSQCAVIGDHLSQDLEDGLGNRLVVDVDQLGGGRVDLEGLVEGEGGIESLGCYRREAKLLDID